MTNVEPVRQAKLTEWLPWREDFLDELLCLDGLDGRPLVCIVCQGPGNLRCTDCCGQDIFCEACLLISHRRLPLHRVEVRFYYYNHEPLPLTTAPLPPQRWNGQYFSSNLLGALGLVVQLGRHALDTKCPHPSRRYQITIFDLTGVHQVVIQYCDCTPGDTAYRRRQLFKMKWFPATLARPHTAFSFRLLDFFHQLQSQNKTNLYDFYNTVVHLSDSAGLSPEVVSVSSSRNCPQTNNLHMPVPLQRDFPRVPDVGTFAHLEARRCCSSPWGC